MNELYQFCNPGRPKVETLTRLRSEFCSEASISALAFCFGPPLVLKLLVLQLDDIDNHQHHLICINRTV